MIRSETVLPTHGLEFLKWCYQFVNDTWQHADRDNSLPDQGFETELRTRATLRFAPAGWRVSQHREMHLTGNLQPASGVFHEIDLVAHCSDVVAVAELKNRIGSPPEKNDVIVFFAKLLDYLALNPALLNREVIPIFLTTIPFEQSGLAACLGLGIHPAAPSLRPLPVLIDSGIRMRVELQNKLSLPDAAQKRFDDFAGEVNRISLTLEPMGLSHRCGYSSEATISLRAIDGAEAAALAGDFRRINAECSELLAEFRAAKGMVVTG